MAQIVTKIATSAVGIGAILGTAFYILNYTEIGKNVKCVLNPAGCAEEKVKTLLHLGREGVSVAEKGAKKIGMLYSNTIKPKASHIANDLSTNIKKDTLHVTNDIKTAGKATEKDIKYLTDSVEHDVVTLKRDASAAIRGITHNKTLGRLLHI